ncbi:hypothetical protein LCGC14_0962990 [marine sediment metagenome]|uniref:Uncharacterized protein n=1 Tax=marine sediment metagenome TaxID=412755 RepID=A0A0F9NE04_9ZZZZ
MKKLLYNQNLKHVDQKEVKRSQQAGAQPRLRSSTTWYFHNKKVN